MNKTASIVSWAAEMVDSYSGSQADSQGFSKVADVLYCFTSLFCSWDEHTESWPVKDVPQSWERAAGWWKWRAENDLTSHMSQSKQMGEVCTFVFTLSLKAINYAGIKQWRLGLADSSGKEHRGLRIWVNTLMSLLRRAHASVELHQSSHLSQGTTSFTALHCLRSTEGC